MLSQTALISSTDDARRLGFFDNAAGQVWGCSVLNDTPPSS